MAKPSLETFECIDCKDTGTIVKRVPILDPETNEAKRNKYGYEMYEDVGKVCECVTEKAFQNRMKGIQLPEEFEHCRFDNYEQQQRAHKQMYEMITDYLKNFASIRETKRNSLGFFATFGEMAIKALKIEERATKKQNHNSYGLGKSHLQTAASKWLVKNIRIPIKNDNGEIVGDRGCKVLYISDKGFMDELMSSKRLDDNNKTTDKLLQMVLGSDVLIWDDLGKSKHTEAKEDMYYYIINEYYKARKPIIWSSNECENTLGEKIGYAASDRLLGMSLDYLLAVEGDSYRLK